MDSALRNRCLLSLDDVSDQEMVRLVTLAFELKAKKRAGMRGDLLLGRNVAMVFEKSSTRTRCAVAVAAADEGAHTEYLASHEIHLGKKESVADTARVLGRMFDGVMYRGYSQRTVELLAEHAGVPVWNGLTDDEHPTQALADLMTVRETFGRLKDLKLVYVGDGRNNVVNSLMAACAKCGMHFVNCTPKDLFPDPSRVEAARTAADRNGGSIEVVEDPAEALPGANAVYTDVWVSMGEEDQKEERMRLLKPYQVNMEMMNHTGHVNDGKVIFLHCLPAFHDDQTAVTAKTGAMEVTDDVFESDFSKVFDQAENRMHTIKAIMIATVTGRLHAASL